MANKENVRRWVDALRSGRYRQTRRVLRNRDGEMCCLGVACEVSGLGEWRTNAPGWDPSDDNEAQRELYVLRDGHVAATVLPTEVMSWLGIDEQNPPLWVRDVGHTTLAGLNDDHDFDFARIADVIERKWLS